MHEDLKCQNLQARMPRKVKPVNQRWVSFKNVQYEVYDDSELTLGRSPSSAQNPNPIE